MGNSGYSSNSRGIRSQSLGYTTKSAKELFSSKLHGSLDSKNIKFREARDSKEHPHTYPVILALDVTGSMGRIPHHLLAHGLPTMVQTLMDNGLNDCPICFVAVGDQYRDKAPIQIAQFESGDEELDIHLQNTWIESGGGGNGGESYPLVYYFAAHKTQTDAWEKRKEKGFIFTIGDEFFHPTLEANMLNNLFNERLERDLTAKEVYEQAKERYHIFHLNLDRGTDSRWKNLIGEGNLPVEDEKDIPNIIAKTILSILKSEVPSLEENQEEIKEEPKITL